MIQQTLGVSISLVFYTNHVRGAEKQIFSYGQKFYVPQFLISISFPVLIAYQNCKIASKLQIQT